MVASNGTSLADGASSGIAGGLVVRTTDDGEVVNRVTVEAAVHADASVTDGVELQLIAVPDNC